MSFRSIVVITSVVLSFGFLFWKVMAMGFGLSYRHKWVRVVDAVALSAIVTLYVLLHNRWGALYRPGGAWVFYSMVAVFLGISVLCTCHSYVIDKARHKAYEPRSQTDTPE